MGLGIVKRVRSEYGDALEDNGPGDRSTFTSVFFALVLVLVLAVGGIFYVERRVASSQEALAGLVQDLRAQRDALEDKIAALGTSSAELQQRIEKLEKAPAQMDQILLRTTLYDISQKLTLLKAQPSFSPETVQALSRMEAEMQSVLRQAGVSGQ
ncbi:MAG: hypothetical protein PWQ57_482 [Desulfovibrionales bacterium]|jgi:uncharacterized protein HemX|nr:hypothetical protein [Desulfovibrionales bacterium]